MDMADLKLASIETARSVIITPMPGPLADAEAIKTVSRITRDPKRRFEPYHIVAGIRNPDNRQVTEVVGRGEVEWIHISEVISRIIAQLQGSQDYRSSIPTCWTTKAMKFIFLNRVFWLAVPSGKPCIHMKTVQ